MTTVEIVRQALRELDERERKLEPLLAEATAVKRAIKDITALLLRLEGTHDGSKTGRRTKPWVPAPNSQAGEILNMLREHERGLHTKVVARELDAPLKTVDTMLCRLLKAGYLERPAPGFYKLAANAPTEDEIRERQVASAID